MVLVRTVIDALFIAYYFQVYSFTFVMPGTDQILFSRSSIGVGTLDWAQNPDQDPNIDPMKRTISV